MSGQEVPEPGKRTGVIFMGLAWLLGLGLLTAWFSDWLSDQRNPNQEVQSIQRGERVEVVLEANRVGHYVASGRLNGVPVTFLLDTGATQVAVPQEIAERAGLIRGPSGQVQTANGLARAWATRIERLSLGGITLEKVPATIVPGMGMDEVLLGMSALGRVDFAQESGRLRLQQKQ